MILHGHSKDAKYKRIYNSKNEQVCCCYRLEVDDTGKGIAECFTTETGNLSMAMLSDTFKVYDIRAEDVFEFDEVSEDIEKILYSAKINERLKIFVNQLKERAYIEYK